MHVYRLCLPAHDARVVGDFSRASLFANLSHSKYTHHRIPLPPFYPLICSSLHHLPLPSLSLPAVGRACCPTSCYALHAARLFSIMFCSLFQCCVVHTVRNWVHGGSNTRELEFPPGSFCAGVFRSPCFPTACFRVLVRSDFRPAANHCSEFEVLSRAHHSRPFSPSSFGVVSACPVSLFLVAQASQGQNINVESLWQNGDSAGYSAMIGLNHAVLRRYPF